MPSRAAFVVAFLMLLSPLAPELMAQSPAAAAEYSRHFGALTKLSIAVAQAMPADQYGFRPHPESMNFGELMNHIAGTNYQFCAGLKDSDPPSLPSPTDKDGIVKFLSDSFDYCSGIINNLSEKQLTDPHNSPDGRMSGRDVLLAMYVHVAHHRGQAEIYLRDKGVKPPPYRV
ncbi:MAG TPA: DinB family protein [Candidatus Sulfotelmatobacter sp.]|nr:DinB family protein [Candidatus Sulfotelmatobacter sp.]